jgi:hypothetical protein
MKSHKILAGLALALLLTSFATVARAQDITGSISGTVTDAKGAAVVNATVTLTNTDKGVVVRTVTTDDRGEFRAPLLPLGHYTVTAETSGFKKTTHTGIILNYQDKLTVNLTLQVGTVTEVVTVQASATQVELQTATASGLITGTQVRELALNTRNYEQLVTLMPGVSSGAGDQIYIGNSLPSGLANVVSFSINGQRNSANNWTVDGADNVDRGSNLTLGTYPSVDAIAEFKVQRGLYDAQFGRAAGGQINVVTKSGGSGYHGDAYEFFRNDVLAANNFFNNAAVPRVPRPPLRYHDFGYTIGGPIIKNHTFFFFSEEFRRVITYSTATATVPTPGMLTGTFLHPVCVAASGTTCTTTSSTISTINPVAAAYIKDIFSKLPSPNSPATSAFTLVTPFRNTFNARQELVRIDHTFNSKLTVYGRYLHDSIPTVEPGGLFTGSTLPGVAITTTNSPGYSWIINYTATLSPRLLNDGGFNFTYSAIISDPSGLGNSSTSPDIGAAITLPFKSTLGRVPALSLTGGSGVAGFGPYRDYNRNKNVFDNLTLIRGRHTFKFGGSYNYYQKSENAGGNNVGTFTFVNTPLPSGTTNFEQSWANFLLGNVATYTQTSLDLTPDIRQQEVEVYGQDEIRVRSNLTLTLGMRWGRFGQPYDKAGLLTNFDPSLFKTANAPTMNSNGTLCLPTTTCDAGKTPNPSFDPLNGISVPGKTSPYGQNVSNQDNKNFAPRIGIAWDPFKDGKTSIRSGYGLFYDSGLVGVYEQNIFANPPFLQNVSIPNTSFSTPGTGTATVSSTPLVLRGTPVPFHTPYTQQWSLDMQRQIRKDLILDIGYYGNNAHHLLGIVDMNEVVPGAGAAAGLSCGTPGTPCTTTTIFTATTTPLLNNIRPFKGYNAINVVQSGFNSNYHSLQASLEKHWGTGSMFQVFYTWSHNLTNAQSDRSSAPQNIYNIRGDYGRSALDRRHIVTASYVYEFPWFKSQQGFEGHVLGGWVASGMVNWSAGAPLTVTTSGVDPGGLGFLGSSAAGGRPDINGDPNAGAAHLIPAFFNTLVFTTVPQGTIRPGNSTRGTVTGPDIQTWNMSLFKNTKIPHWESSYFQLRVELFNVWNHTNFNAVGTAVGAATYGKVTSARDPRIMQLGLKWYF